MRPWDESQLRKVDALAKLVLERFRNKKDNSDKTWRLENLLRYFVRSGGDPIALRAEEIAKNVFEPGRTKEVKVYVARLRDELEDYFLNMTLGRMLDHRLEIPNKAKGGAYELNLVPNVRRLTGDQRFWDIYTASDSHPLIIYPHPLFFWDKTNRLYLRFLDINAENQQELDDKFKKIVQKLGLKNLEPCFHYVSIGESKMIRHLQHWFRKHWFAGMQLPLKDRGQHEHKSPLEVINSREITEEKAYTNNIILLGNARTNKYISFLQSRLSYQLEADHVTGPGSKKGERIQFRDSEEGIGPSYVVVTRIPSLKAEKEVTIIAANNGIAGAKVVEELTSKTFLETQLFGYMGWDTDKPLPHHFQILFEVQADRDLATNVEPIGKTPA